MDARKVRKEEGTRRDTRKKGRKEVQRVDGTKSGRKKERRMDEGKGGRNNEGHKKERKEGPGLTAQVRAEEPNQNAIITLSSSAKFCFTATPAIDPSDNTSNQPIRQHQQSTH